MNNPHQNFYRALLVLNSLLFPVFILSFVEILNLSFLLKFGFIVIFLITASLKIYCMSAMGGCILEIISGEEIVLRIRRVHQNAMKLWPGFLVVFVIIRLIDFLLFVLFPAFRIWRTVYFSLLEVIAAYVLARWAINQKYTGPLGIPAVKFKFGSNFIMVIILAYLSELILVGVLSPIPSGGFYWRNILAFMLNYIHVFEFIFCSLYILDHYPEINKKFSLQKEVFLINPMGARVVDGLASIGFNRYPPVFVVLKALSPKTYKFHEFNRVIWHERYYKSNVLVCVTCFTSNSYEAYKIAKEFKKRGSKVVMGGPHVTYFPSEALAFCDSVVLGQVEGVWKQVLRDHENGALKAQYMAAATEADYHQVHEELLSSPPSIAKEFLETSRGCKFRCHFCTIPALSNGKVRLQSINDIIDLVKKIKPHCRDITFIDNNIYSDPGYAKELFIALKPLKIKWRSQCTIDIAKNQETLKLARESGCTDLLVGYEIFNGSQEKDQGGKFAMAQKYIEYTKIIKKAGIRINGRFIFGFDSDNFETLFQLWKFCFSIMPLSTGVSILTPLPGSGVYRDMLAQNRIINLNWRNYAATKLVLRHPYMDPAWMSFFFPLIQTFFFLTTSTGGFALLVILLFFPGYGLGYFTAAHR
jgi:radical SAM superfamily enzyme YgiQ (UPF0313 family)